MPLIDLIDKEKKVYVFVGSAGTGKTEVAINFSLNWAKKKGEVYLVDLDIVKPYFRSREVKDRFRSFKLDVISPADQLYYSDLPALSPQIESHLINMNERVVIDLGGGEEGSPVLGRYRHYIRKNDYDIFYVANTRRPFNATADEIINQIEIIQNVSKIEITGIVHNTHLMWETNFSMIINSIPIIEKVSKTLSLPVVFHGVSKSLIDDAKKSGIDFLELECFLWPEWAATT